MGKVIVIAKRDINGPKSIINADIWNDKEKKAKYYGDYIKLPIKDAKAYLKKMNFEQLKVEEEEKEKPTPTSKGPDKA